MHNPKRLVCVKTTRNLGLICPLSHGQVTAEDITAVLNKQINPPLQTLTLTGLL